MLSTIFTAGRILQAGTIFTAGIIDANILAGVVTFATLAGIIAAGTYSFVKNN